jgi:hypothetical protein
MPQYDPTGSEQRFNQAALGGQDFLRVCTAAAPNQIGLQNAFADPTSGNSGIINQPLVNLTLNANGTYLCTFPLNGMASVNTHIKATFGGGTTVTTAGYTTYKDHQTARTAFTGMGALTTATLQSATPALSAPAGEEYGVVSITIASLTGTVTFQIAEYCGQRG